MVGSFLSVTHTADTGLLNVLIISFITHKEQLG